MRITVACYVIAFFLLVACSHTNSDIALQESPEALVGAWQDKGDIIIFRTDGTFNWSGQEGTYEIGFSTIRFTLTSSGGGPLNCPYRTVSDKLVVLQCPQYRALDLEKQPTPTAPALTGSWVVKSSSGTAACAGIYTTVPLWLNSDGTYTFARKDPSDSTVEETGTYSVSGSSLTFQVTQVWNTVPCQTVDSGCPITPTPAQKTRQCTYSLTLNRDYVYDLTLQCGSDSPSPNGTYNLCPTTD